MSHGQEKLNWLDNEIFCEFTDKVSSSPGPRVHHMSHVTWGHCLPQVSLNKQKNHFRKKVTDRVLEH